MFRQGDVLLVPVAREELPKERKLVRRRKQQGVILAAGEATGHHHRVREKGARMYRADDGQRYLTIGSAGGTLTHEEHDPIPLPAHSVFKIVQQREYAPELRAESRPVRD